MALKDRRKIPIENTTLGIIYDNPLDHLFKSTYMKLKTSEKRCTMVLKIHPRKRKEKKKLHPRNTIQ
jgi:hypothetical protein